VKYDKTNEQNVSLRSASDADASFLEMVYADSRREELASLGWSREQENAFFKMQFELQSRAYKMQFPDADFHIVELENKPVGRLIVWRSEKEVRLVDVSVLSEFRNRGIGSLLIEKLKSEIGSNRVLLLRVLKTNSGAKRLYERYGFVVTEETDLHFTMQWRNF
jgi:ribosomal protein S18 acetylase RimI-like enzyme